MSCLIEPIVYCYSTATVATAHTALHTIAVRRTEGIRSGLSVEHAALLIIVAHSQTTFTRK